MVYQFPWYGIQGEGGFYGPEGDRVFPGIDLVEVSNARSVVLLGATFPLLADHTTEIRPDPPDPPEYHYGDLHCGDIENQKLHIAQKYLFDKGYNQGSEKISAIIKVKTGQSENLDNLCGSEDYKPDWSHICVGDWAYNQLVSATPNDIDVQYCTNQEGLQAPLTGKGYSQNIYDYTATLINGCSSEDFGNYNYSFENQCDVHWAGLGVVAGCIPDGPYFEDDGTYLFSTLDQAREYGRHLAHHYMQAYSSFSQALDTELYGQTHYGYPFGISSVNLGLLVGRWIYQEYGVDEAIRFSNIFYSEVRKGAVEINLGMHNIDPNYDADNPGVSLWSTANQDKWKYDFGLLFSEPEKVNKLAVFNNAFLQMIFLYIKEDLKNPEPVYFDGLVIQYYNHWSCIGAVIEYLNWLRDDLKGGGDGEGVAALPIVIDELGNRQRLQSFDPAAYCISCTKNYEYETGWSRSRIAGLAWEDELKNTQAAETARKLIRFSAPREDGSGNNIRGVMWEWMMKPRDCPSDKCELVQSCGNFPQLPGYRYPAFDAYKFFVHLINRVMYWPDYMNIDTAINDPDIEVYQVTFKKDETLLPSKHVTAYWGYNILNPHLENISGSTSIERPDDRYDEAYVYNAVGEQLNILPVNGEYVDAPYESSPRYLSWGCQVIGWSNDNVDNYSEVVFQLNQAASADPKIPVKEFDSGAYKRNIVEETPGDFTDMRALAWSATDGRLLVTSNPTSGPRVFLFHGLTGGYNSKIDIDDIDAADTILEVRGIAADIVAKPFGDTDLIHVLAREDKLGADDFWLKSYFYFFDEDHPENNEWQKEQYYDIDETGWEPGEEPEQIRQCVYWSQSKAKFKPTLFISTHHRILYLNKEQEPNVTVDNFTEPVQPSLFNGFGFALDGNLYVADAHEDKNAIRKFAVDWSQTPAATLASSGHLQFEDKPTGFRISPFGTLCATLAVSDGSFRVIEIVPDENGVFTLSEGRYIVNSGSTDFFPGDLEFSRNR